MAKLHVQPRQTPAERAGAPVEIDVDEDLTVHVVTMEEWVAHRGSWELTLREGHDFGRPNNVEARLLHTEGAETSSCSFRLDQLDAVEDRQDELALRLEERDGIAKLVRCTPTGLAVELFHILTFT